jgi:hypothetical protein
MAEVPPPDIEIENVEIPQLQDAPSEDPVATDQLEDELIADIEPAKTEERSGLRKLLSSAIGTDLTSMAVPVTYNEPLSFLQRMYEYVQYHDLLTKANNCEDPYIRMLYVTAFAVTCFAGTDRKVKPFNPLLGETFEYVDEKAGLRFHSEQVSHHPPIGASHCETDQWMFYQTQSVKTKFLGNSLDVTPIGVSHVVLKRFDEHYQWPNIKTIVHNLIIGRMWVDHFGPCPVTVTKNETGEKIAIKGDLRFKECGWFGRGWHEIDGAIVNTATGGSKGTAMLELSGKWTEQVSAVATTHGKSLSDPAAGLTFNTKTPTLVWKHVNSLTADPVFAKHDWSDVTVALVQTTDDILKQIPLTDARLREDRYLLQLGEIKKASAAKHALEEAQRARKRHRDTTGATTWTPRYFELARNADGSVAKNLLGDDQWVTKKNYWSERDARIKRYAETGKQASYEAANKQWRFAKDWTVEKP